MSDGQPAPAHPDAVVAGPTSRITVLTSRLLRFEWHPEGRFVDERTQAVVNRSRSALRHRGVVERHAARQAPPADEPPADEGIAGAGRRTAVLDALRRLPDRQREVLALRYYLDLSEAEIADALGIARGSVKAHASRGAATLRSLLADPHAEGDL